MKKTFCALTLGCKVNQYETQVLREEFLRRGYAEKEKDADLVIINTCTVTGRSDRKCRQVIRSASRRHPRARLVVTGCYAERAPDELKTIPGVTKVVGNRDKSRIADLIAGENPDRSSEGISGFAGHNRAFVKIEDGCNNSCTYCIVPKVRGRVKSRPAGEIVAEVARLVKNGFKEIVLTGVNLGAYGRDLEKKDGLLRLLDDLEILGGNFRLRLGSIELKDIDERLVGKIARSARIVPALAIPLQAGDDEILSRMGRPYTGREYLARVRSIRRKIPRLSLAADILVGFPGESEQNFLNTLQLVKKIAPSRVHLFSFSPRPGTPAADFPGQASSEVIKERKARLGEIARTLSYHYRRRFLGKEVEVLVEAKRGEARGELSGYTETYFKVDFWGPAELINELVKVKVVEVGEDFTRGELRSN